MKEAETVKGARTEALWCEFHSRLMSYIHRRIASADDAEDIFQEVFLRIHRSGDRLAEVRDLSAWIFGVARNAITDYYRGRSRGLISVTGLPGDPSAPGSDSPPVRESCDCGCHQVEELTNCVEPLVSFLPEPYREAVRLTELGRLTQREAAARVGISLSGMKSRVQRGREKLKDLLVSFCSEEIEERYRSWSGGRHRLSN